MIRINLLPGPQKKRRGGAGFTLASATELLAKVKNPMMIGLVAAWVVGVGAVAGLWVLQSRQLAAVQEEHGRVEAEARRYRTLIREKRRAEGLRDSLIAEINAIRAIDGERYVWPHILEEVTKALPDYTWLISLQSMAVSMDELTDTTAPPPIRFSIEGRTPDLSAYTRFVSQLAASPWVRNAEFGAVQSVLEDERPVQSFSVAVTFRTADSAFIRLAPIQESVR
jgi:Tfp pilus assembly protein PilN